VIEGKQYLSIRDIIMHMCEKDSNDAGQIWRRTSQDNKNEVQTFCLHVQFPGRGEKTQPVITFPGAIKLAMFLPGEKAKSSRSQMTSILQRYFAGDKSLITEIEANAISSDPVAQMARDSLPEPSVEDRAIETRKRRLEIETLEVELESKRIRNVRDNMEAASQFQDIMARIHMNTVLDSRTRLNLEDMVKNNMFNKPMPSQAAIENGPSQSQSISISEIAKDLGVGKLSHGQLVSVGASVARAFESKHDGEKPSKHRQWVDGKEVMVNSYTESDRDIVEEAILRVCSKKAKSSQ